jgi:hypothetical protein
LLSNALAILCALAAVVLATSATRRTAAALMAAAFLGGLLVFLPARFPDPSWCAAALALAAGAALWKPRWSVFPAACAGLAAAVWAELLAAQGLPALPVYVAVAAVASGSAVLASTRGSFAPAILREEALMIVAVFALIVTAGPSVLQGFDSAVALTAVRLSGDSSLSAPWALIVAAGCLALGVVYSLWKRHR